MSVQAEEIPQHLEGWARWQRNFEQSFKMLGREIDFAFYNFGLDKTFPPVVRYMIAALICSSPIIMVFAMLCCCVDDDEMVEEQNEEMDARAERWKQLEARRAQF